jgi:hypothetical protein
MQQPTSQPALLAGARRLACLHTLQTRRVVAQAPPHPAGLRASTSRSATPRAGPDFWNAFPRMLASRPVPPYRQPASQTRLLIPGLSPSGFLPPPSRMQPPPKPSRPPPSPQSQPSPDRCHIAIIDAPSHKPPPSPSPHPSLPCSQSVVVEGGRRTRSEPPPKPPGAQQLTVLTRRALPRGGVWHKHGCES